MDIIIFIISVSRQNCKKITKKKSTKCIFGQVWQSISITIIISHKQTSLISKYAHYTTTGNFFFTCTFINFVSKARQS